MLHTMLKLSVLGFLLHIVGNVDAQPQLKPSQTKVIIMASAAEIPVLKPIRKKARRIIRGIKSSPMAYLDDVEDEETAMVLFTDTARYNVYALDITRLN